jgi:hypothetical protein
MDFAERMKESWNYKMTSILAGAIRFKFPNIKNLDIVSKDDGTYSITFDDDDIHTFDIVNSYLDELKGSSK